jgi:hypothetical protein
MISNKCSILNRELKYSFHEGYAVNITDMQNYYRIIQYACRKITFLRWYAQSNCNVKDDGAMLKRVKK